MPELPLAADCIVRVRVTPRGGRNAVIGVRGADSVLLLRVAAPPVDGAANRACVELVADACGVRRAQVHLIGGATTRDKRFRVTGITEAERDARLATFPVIAGEWPASDRGTMPAKDLRDGNE